MKPLSPLHIFYTISVSIGIYYSYNYLPFQVSRHPPTLQISARHEEVVEYPIQKYSVLDQPIQTTHSVAHSISFIHIHDLCEGKVVNANKIKARDDLKTPTLLAVVRRGESLSGGDGDTCSVWRKTLYAERADYAGLVLPQTGSQLSQRDEESMIDPSYKRKIPLFVVSQSDGIKLHRLYRKDGNLKYVAKIKPTTRTYHLSPRVLAIFVLFWVLIFLVPWTKVGYRKLRVGTWKSRMLIKKWRKIPLTRWERHYRVTVQPAADKAKRQFLNINVDSVAPEKVRGLVDLVKDFVNGAQGQREADKNFNDGGAFVRQVSDFQRKPFPLDYVIHRNILKIDKGDILGEGGFGMVYKGFIQNEYLAAVKAVKQEKERRKGESLLFVQNFEIFLDEIKLMAYIGDHDHILCFYGAVFKHLDHGQVYAVMEFSPWGSLKDYLQKYKQYYVPHISKSRLKTASRKGEPILSIFNLVSWAHQIASGMEFIASKNVKFKIVDNLICTFK